MTYITRFLKETWQVLRNAKRNMLEDEPIVHSAAIAFFTIFSLPAILLVLTFIGTLFFSGDTVREQIVREVGNLISANAANEVRKVLGNLTELKLSFWEVVVGVVLVLQSSSIVLFMMQKALNTVWRVRVRPGTKLLKVVTYRLSALGIVAGLGLLLVLSLVLDTLITVNSAELRDVLEEHFSPTIRAVNTVFYLGVVLIFFTTIHKVLPDVKIAWKDALAGGVITSLLFLMGKEIINLVLGGMRVVSIYAAAGSLVVVLLWVFYSSVVFVLGAEITKAYAERRGREVKAKSIAVKYERVSQKGEEV